MVTATPARKPRKVVPNRMAEAFAILHISMRHVSRETGINLSVLARAWRQSADLSDADKTKVVTFLNRVTGNTKFKITDVFFTGDPFVARQ